MIDNLIPLYTHFRICHIHRLLPVREVAPGKHLGILRLIGDPFLTDIAGRELAKMIPSDVSVIVMPDGKALGLLHVVQMWSGIQNAVVARKEVKSYMRAPTLSAQAVSATSQRVHEFFVDADDAEMIANRVVLILDDVVSTGGTTDAIHELVRKCGAVKVYVMAVATEGERRDDVIALRHLEVFRS